MTGGRSVWIRLPFAAALCLFLLWTSLGSAMNVVLAQSAPRLALRWWPMGAEAKAGLAAASLAPGATRQDVARARALAVQAMVREPALGPAASVLGLADTMAGDLPAADRVFAYAERLSRRDLSTQMWLIQRRVDGGDVAGALAHYDLALRTNRQSYDMLLPVLAAASANAPVRDALLPYLARRADWSGAYAQQLVTTGGDPDGLFAQVRAMRLDPARDDERALLGKAVERLVALDRPLLAARLVGVRGGALRDGGFDAPGSFPPFDWWLSDDPGLSATRERRDTGANSSGGSDALHVVASGERGGEVAHQLLLLPAGHFRLGGRVAAEAADKASTLLFSLACAGRGTQLLAARVDAGAGRDRTFALAFDVPAGCPAQWLRIATPPATDVDGWVDDLSITPVAAAGHAVARPGATG